MTDRPIIFSAPMMRALLDGRKTQTRRLISTKGQANLFNGNWTDEYVLHHENDEWRARYVHFAPGDRLYVREAWRVGAWNQCDGGIAVDYLADNYARKEWLYSPSWTDQVHTRLIEQSRADAEKAGAYRPGGGWEYSWSPGNSPCRSRPSIHMPRWASRLTLTVKEVRVQRLQEISEADAKAEGLATVTKDGNLWKWGIADRDGLPGNDNHGWHWKEWEVDPRAAFKTLWNSIHGPDAWDANPWVVALTFTVQNGNIDQIGGAA